MIPYKQLSLADIFQDCQNKVILMSDKKSLETLHIDKNRNYSDFFLEIISMHQREDPDSFPVGFLSSVSSQSLQTSFF